MKKGKQIKLNDVHEIFFFDNFDEFDVITKLITEMLKIMQSHWWELRAHQKRRPTTATATATTQRVKTESEANEIHYFSVLCTVHVFGKRHLLKR